MARLFRNTEGSSEGKYLVKRRDGTVPEWPYFVIGAKDPAAHDTLLRYAFCAEQLGMDPEYVADVRQLAKEFKAYREANGCGDPDGARHRQDDPETVAEMAKGKSA